MAGLIIYLIKVSVIQLVAYLSYRLLLEQEPYLNFRRWYLVGTLLLSFWIPVWVVWQIVLPALPTDLLNNSADYLPVQDNYSSVFTEGTVVLKPLILAYLTGLVIAGWRMFRKLGWVRRQLRAATTKTYADGVCWTGLSYPTTPHTFGPYIFHEADKPLPPGVREHELTHARQWHTLDRLLIGLVRCVCWFNPLLSYYEQAISLNHELIADRMAMRRSGLSIFGYQTLLLDHLSRGSRAPVYGSGMTFTLIKKRFHMLRISPSRPGLLLGKLVAIGLLWIGLIAGFGDTAYAQTDPAPPPPPAPAAPPPPPAKPTAPDAAPPAPPMPSSALWVPAPPPPPPGAPDMTVIEWHNKWYEQQRKTNPDLPPPPPFPADIADMKLSEWQLMKKKERLQKLQNNPAPSLSATELSAYQDPKIYGVWLNGKRVENGALASYHPEQLRRRFQSTLKKNAAQYGQYTYHLELTTEEHYQREIERLRQEIGQHEH